MHKGMLLRMPWQQRFVSHMPTRHDVPHPRDNSIMQLLLTS